MKNSCCYDAIIQFENTPNGNKVEFSSLFFISIRDTGQMKELFIFFIISEKSSFTLQTIITEGNLKRTVFGYHVIGILFH